MDDPISKINDIIQAAGSTVSLLDKLLATMDKWGFLHFTEGRKKNMRAKQEFLLELEAQQNNHKRREAMADARVNAEISLIMAQAKVGIEAMGQDGQADGESGIDAVGDLEFTRRAAKSVYRQAMSEQYSRERIGLYAAVELADAGASDTNDEPSDTWMSRFMKYAGEVRDEDVMRLWGKILAGEIKRPGSFSLKTMDILSTLDRRDANNFFKIAPYVMNANFIPEGAFEKAGINFLEVINLESLGLITRGKMTRLNGAPTAANKKYFAAPKGGENFPGRMLEINTSLLTYAGTELYNMLDLPEKELLAGAELFAEIITNKYGVPMEIVPTK